MKTLLNFISFLVGLVFIILSLSLMYVIASFGILPYKYLILVDILMGVLILIFSFFLFRIPRKKKKKKKKIVYTLKIIFLIITLIFIGGYSYIIYSLNKTLNLFDNVLIMKEEVTNYYIMTLKDTKYEEVSDLDGQSIGYFFKMDEKILGKIKLDLKKIEENDVNVLKDKLLNKEIESIIVSDVIKSKYEEEDSTFMDKVNILKTISIKSKIEDITKRVSIKNTPFNVLISGIDTYGDINNVSRNDVNIVATINPNTNEILLTSIPRDYYVQLHGTTGYRDKLTHASSFGFNMAIETIEDILDIDINYYIKVNFNTVIDLVNVIGGVEVNSDRYLNLGGCKIKKGYNNLNGKCALAYARERHSYEDGDRHRGRNQQEVITSIFKKLTSGTTILTQYNNILSKLDGKFATSLDMDEVFNFIKYEIDDLSSYTITSIQLDGTGLMTKTYSYPHQDLWVMVPDEDTVIKAKDKINSVIEGDK